MSLNLGFQSNGNQPPKPPPKRIVLAIPADVKTEPAEGFVFNCPFVKPQKCTLRLSNTGLKRIGFSLKSTNIKRFKFSPTCGALGPWEKTTLNFTCEAIDDYDEKLQKEKTPNRITLEWVNAPNNEEGFHRDWFAINGLVRRKMINITYNL